MPKLRTLLLSLLATALVAGSAGASQALASNNQTTYFEGAAVLLNPSTRPHAMEQMQHLGVKALRVELNWDSVAPGSHQRHHAQVRSDQPRQLRLGRSTRSCSPKLRLANGRCC